MLSGKREGDFRPDADRFKKPGGKNDYARKYRTEFTIIGDGFLPVHELERKLALLGTGVAVASDDGKIKVKLHTDLPHRALGAGLHFGELTGIRIDNLTQTEDRHEHRRQI